MRFCLCTNKIRFQPFFLSDEMVNRSEIRQSKINSRSVAGPMGQMNRRPSVWCSKYYFFHDFLQNSLQKYFQSICLFFLKNTKIKVKSFECPKSIKSLKKIILGTSDAWSTIRLSNRPSDPAWIYLRLTDFNPLVQGVLCLCGFFETLEKQLYKQKIVLAEEWFSTKWTNEDTKINRVI